MWQSAECRTGFSSIPPAEVDESCLDRYDTFITTEKGRYYDMGLALYISQFPTRRII